MRMTVTVLPNTVSFNNIRIMERITDDGVPTGYFTNEEFRAWWNHQMVQGAGRLVSVSTENSLVDNVEMTGICPILETGLWSSGDITWTIPCAWKEDSTISISQPLTDFVTKEQVFTINEQGTVQVIKFGCRAVRTPLGYSDVFMPE